jgi:hypothetical protein
MSAMKRNILISSVAGAGLLIFSVVAPIAAQDRDRDRDSYQSERESYFHDQQWRGHLFERVRQDVEHVRATTWPSGGDDYRLDQTMEELNELQSKLANHVYDERELDEVITALGRVASYNRMAPRDRDMLTDDVSRMRDYRERHADWDRDRDRER